MNIRCLATSLLLGISILSGCSDNSITYEMGFTEPTTTIITNPFKPDDSIFPLNDDVISYGFSINIPDFEFLTCENNKVTLPIAIENAGKEFNLGFYIFSDGIIQEYTSSVSDKKTTMQTFEIQRDSIQVIDFYIENIENISLNDEVSFSFLTMINPEFIPSIDNISENLPHNTSGGSSLHLHMDSPSEVSKYKIYSDFDIHIVSDEEASRFGILLDDRDTSHSTKFILDTINEIGRPRENMIAATEDGSLVLNLFSWTINGNDSFSANGTYRVSFYKNHERVKFNGDFDYMDIELKESYITTAEVALENISEGDFIYCIAVPIDNYKLNAQKSMTALILNPNDMPLPIDESLYFTPVYIEQNPTENNENNWIGEKYNDVEEFLKDNTR